METKEPTPTIVHNYYGITFQNCSMPNATIQTISQPSADTRRAPDTPMPEALRTPLAETLRSRLADAGLVDGHWQPQSLSNAEKGVLASLLADRLEIGNHWKFFGRLWGMNSETLRTAYNKGMDQHRTADFMERVKNALKG